MSKSCGCLSWLYKPKKPAADDPTSSKQPPPPTSISTSTTPKNSQAATSSTITSNNMSVFLVVGSSMGFGEQFVLEALRRGNKVIAASRSASKLTKVAEAGAATISLDINEPQEKVTPIIHDAIKIYGRIDYLINNAGYILEGATEEATDEEIYKQFNTNVFGQVRVLKAILPHMRERKSGGICMVGSLGGWMGGFGASHYSASKWAVAAIALALKQEVASFNIDVFVLEPGFFRTNLLASGSSMFAGSIDVPDLKPVMEGAKQMMQQLNKNQPGDPAKGAEVVIDCLTHTGRFEGKKTPGRLPLGDDALGYVRQIVGGWQQEIDEYAPCTANTSFTS